MWFSRYMAIILRMSLQGISSSPAAEHSEATLLPLSYSLNYLMEMERFELLTPCLQGRCSPN